MRCAGRARGWSEAGVSQDRDILSAAAGLAGAGSPFVMITVIRTHGSTPRNAGAKMLWRPGSNGLTGTVGGGQFELLVLDAAHKCLETRACAVERFVLGADADQCCGGVMEVFLEYHGGGPRLVVFGAGHVSQELADVLSGTGLDLVITDDRADWNSAERFANCRRLLSWDEGIAAAHESAGCTMACVMTCSHDTDFDLLRRLLMKPPAFTGLIGSRSKRVCIFGRLVAAGLDEKAVQRVHCPIGVGDTGKEPRTVAISMAAQLLLEAKRLAPA